LEKTGGYFVRITGLDPEKTYVLRYATGEYADIPSIKNGANAGYAPVAEMSAVTIELPTHGVHTIGIQSGADTEFIGTVTIEASDIEAAGVVCSSYDNTITVENLYGARFVRIEDEYGVQYETCINSKFSFDGIRYTAALRVSDSGTYIVKVTYNDGVVLQKTIEVTVPEPEISVNGRIFTISNYTPNEVSYIRFAKGGYPTAGELKSAPDLRTFGRKYFTGETAAFAALDAENGKSNGYTLQIMFRSGYTTLLYFRVIPTVPSFTVENDSIIVGNVETGSSTLDWIRCAPGELTTLYVVRHTPGSQVRKAENIENGTVSFTGLEPGTYTLYYLYDPWDLSEGMVTVTVE
ncbi:MAG: hypothetical protein IJS94_05140, partial [Clostridia bacterium]|nr:hypothetical protein [Clostridia bacterium]